MREDSRLLNMGKDTIVAARRTAAQLEHPGIRPGNRANTPHPRTGLARLCTYRCVAHTHTTPSRRSAANASASSPSSCCSTLCVSPPGSGAGCVCALTLRL